MPETEDFHGSPAVRGLLADTWWYGLTVRVPGATFASLARQRAEEGFSAIQLVAGIPPEVGPEHPSAASDAGPAWRLDGSFNATYLDLVRERIALLNRLDLRAIVYGAWGHQIAWLGQERMAAWWRELVRALDDLDVIYCLTGESDSWVGEEAQLLPDRSTADLPRRRLPAWLPGRVQLQAYRLYARYRAWRPHRPDPRLLKERRAAWNEVLEALAGMTRRPILAHPSAGQTTADLFASRHLLAANTTQTGHSLATRNALWQAPLRAQVQYPAWPFINLEPWYEGITDHFGLEEQLFAYWAGMLAGCASHCYGAQGIWNAGDGRFLAHWGGQTLEQARQLATPRLLGLSHQELRPYLDLPSLPPQVQNDLLLAISRGDERRRITFYPDIALVPGPLPAGRIWLPLEGRYVKQWPERGPAAVLQIADALSV